MRFSLKHKKQETGMQIKMLFTKEHGLTEAIMVNIYKAVIVKVFLIDRIEAKDFDASFKENTEALIHAYSNDKKSADLIITKSVPTFDEHFDFEILDLDIDFMAKN